MKTKKLIITILIMLGIMLAKSTNAFALQSTTTAGTSSKNDTATNWITSIRKIEGEGGGMGLKETIDKTTALTTSESNNIDVHMQKNTEYGAMVLLGTSNYGKRATNASAENCWMQNGGINTTGTETNLATSTGNISGVYELGYYNMNKTSQEYEWTAGGGTRFLINIDKRYRDIYETEVGKAGDATEEGEIDLAEWHSNSPNSFWATEINGFIRGGGRQGVFARISTYEHSNYYYARAAVVCGTGF